VTRERIRKTKVVATLGPACDSPEQLADLIRGGMNVARLNFSHGSHDEHRKRLEALRQVAAGIGANVAVMLDTKGVKIRTGLLEGGAAQLATGQPFALYTDGRAGNSAGVPTASMDAAAEVSIFERFRERTRDQIAIVISHRFSTVRMADRIVVLDGGSMMESGSHDELVAAGGRYATLFKLQARGYQGWVRPRGRAFTARKCPESGPAGWPRSCVAPKP
jgi:pyruvate kinase